MAADAKETHRIDQLMAATRESAGQVAMFFKATREELIGGAAPAIAPAQADVIALELTKTWLQTLLYSMINKAPEPPKEGQ
jgi:hypothetical protein